MRLLIVVDGALPSLGGAEAQAILLATSLQSRGHEVKLLAPRFSRAEPLADSLEGVPLERIAYPRIRILGAVILMMKFGWRLLTRFRAFHAVHIHMAKNLAAMAGLARPLARWTLTVKISGAWEFDRGILDPTLARHPHVRLLNCFIRRADAIQCISAFTRERLIDAGFPRERIRMIPNAVDLSRFAALARSGVAARAAAGEREPHVVFVGRLVQVKGLDVLLEAWAGVVREIPARLVLVGDGPLMTELREQAERLGIAGRVEFAGDVASPEHYLRRADAYVQPSRQEGLSNAVLEAMACGLPIVATRVSGNEELITNGANGVLVPPDDVQALRAALVSLLERPALRTTMGAASRATVAQRYGLDRILDELERTYGERRTA